MQFVCTALSIIAQNCELLQDTRSVFKVKTLQLYVKLIFSSREAAKFQHSVNKIELDVMNNHRSH